MLPSEKSSMTPDSRYHVHHGDVIPHMAEMPEDSVSCIITSPPFFSVYAYSPSPADMGNTESPAEAKIQRCR